MKSPKPCNLHLPIIKCCCGEEILLVPNIKSMSEAIETHIEHHMKKLKGRKEANVEAERVREDLIAQVFSKAFELSPSISEIFSKRV